MAHLENRENPESRESSLPDLPEYIYVKALINRYSLQEIFETGWYSPFEVLLRDDEIRPFKVLHRDDKNPDVSITCVIPYHGANRCLTMLDLTIDENPLSENNLYEYMSIINNHRRVVIVLEYYVVMVENLFYHAPNPKYASYRVERYYAPSLERVCEFLREKFIYHNGVYHKLHIGDKVNAFINSQSDGTLVGESEELSPQYTRIHKMQHPSRDNGTYENVIRFLNTVNVLCKNEDEYRDAWCKAVEIDDEFYDKYNMYFNVHEYDAYVKIYQHYVRHGHRVGGGENPKVITTYTSDDMHSVGDTQLITGFTTILKVRREFTI